MSYLDLKDLLDFAHTYNMMQCPVEEVYNTYMQVLLDSTNSVDTDYWVNLLNLAG